MANEFSMMQSLVAMAGGYTGGVPTQPSPLVNPITVSGHDSEFVSLQKLVRILSGEGGGMVVQGLSNPSAKLIDVADSTARYALTPADANFGDLVRQNDTFPPTYWEVIDTTALFLAAGYVQLGGSGGNPFDQSLNTIDTVQFAGINLSENSTFNLGLIQWDGASAICFNGIPSVDIGQRILCSENSYLLDFTGSNTNSAPYYFDGTNGNRITGDISGLSGNASLHSITLPLDYQYGTIAFTDPAYPADGGQISYFQGLIVNSTKLTDATGYVVAPVIPPMVDPLIAGAIWNDAGTLKISAGA